MKAWMIWFATGGGVLAWALHLGIAWSVAEVSCYGSLDGNILQRAGRGATAGWVEAGATVLPWLLALAAVITNLAVRRRLRALDPDVLAAGRTGLMLVMGLFLDVMALVAITAGGIGLLVVEPC